MKYFLDTEFIEDGKTIDLISIALVCEDSRAYYAINRNCAFHKADKWVKENVLKPIGLDNGLPGTIQPYMDGSVTLREKAYKENEMYITSKANIKLNILNLLGWTEEGFKPVYTPDYFSDEYRITPETFVPEFWADYCSYDWVVFCQLFGKMIDLPNGFPMYCNDLQQLWRVKGCPELPKQKQGQHNALKDAMYVKDLYEVLTAS